MVRRLCFVPGCKTGYSKDRRKRKIEGVRVPSLFKARSVEEVKQWRKYIPRADREFTMDDRLCALHFLDEDIIKYFETKIYDGTTFRLERGRYKLVDDAVPLIYPCLPNYLSEVVEMRRRMKQESKIASDEEINEKTENSFVSEENLVPNVAEPSKTFSIDSDIERNEKTVDSFGSQENFVLDVEEPPKTLTYDELTENIDCIVRPSILWGITCHELFVMCALWSVEGELQLKVIIDKNMDVKISIKGETIVFKVALTCVEDVSALLSKINGGVTDL